MMRDPHVTPFHATLLPQVDIRVAGAGVCELVTVTDGDEERVDEPVTELEGVGVAVRVIVDVGDGEAPEEMVPVCDGVTVGDGEHESATLSPVAAQPHGHAIGTTVASGQKLPEGQIVGAAAPFAQKLPAGHGFVAMRNVMPDATTLPSSYICTTTGLP